MAYSHKPDRIEKAGNVWRVTAGDITAEAPYLLNATYAGVNDVHAMLGLPPEQVVCVGDQVFRDIRGANSAGLDSILVDFIRLPGETHYGKKRALEKAILWFYHRDPRRRGRLDGIGK